MRVDGNFQHALDAFVLSQLPRELAFDLLDLLAKAFEVGLQPLE